jgi:gcpE protein
LYGIQKNVTVAVMGCAVNGPGEAKRADIGITGGKDFAVIFKHGKIVRNIDLKRESEDEKNKIIDDAFEAELDTL